MSMSFRKLYTIYASIPLRFDSIIFTKYIVYLCKNSLNYVLGSNFSNTLTKHLDLTIPLVQFLNFGTYHKPKAIEEFYTLLSASMIEDNLDYSLSNDELINSATFKTSVKEPVKAYCKMILIPEGIYPALIKGFVCEFLGTMSASSATEIYNKKSILIDYTKLTLKALPDSIAKPPSSLLKKFSIEELGFNYVAGEAVYRILGNNGKMLISSIINYKKNTPPQEFNTQSIIDLFKNITPINSTYISLGKSDIKHCPIPNYTEEIFLLGISQDNLLEINA